MNLFIRWKPAYADDFNINFPVSFLNEEIKYSVAVSVVIQNIRLKQNFNKGRFCKMRASVI